MKIVTPEVRIFFRGVITPLKFIWMLCSKSTNRITWLWNFGYQWNLQSNVPSLSRMHTIFLNWNIWCPDWQVFIVSAIETLMKVADLLPAEVLSIVDSGTTSILHSFGLCYSQGCKSPIMEYNITLSVE